MTPRASERHHARGATLILFTGAAIAYLAIALWLDRLGGFTYIDALFNADAPWYLRGFVEGSGTGTGWGPRSFVHPNIANIIHPIVAAAGALLDWLGVSGTGSGRRLAALAVTPVAAAAEVALLYRILRPISAAAGLQAAAYAALFATTLFAAVPESFAFTGLGLALLLWSLERERLTGKSSTPLLVAIGALLSSVTITNAALVALCVAVHRLARSRDWREVPRAVPAVAGGVILTAAVALLLGGIQGRLSDYVPRFEQLHEAPLLRDVATGRTAPMTAHITRYWRRATVDVPQAITYAIAPPAATVVLGKGDGSSDAPIGFTYQGTDPDWLRIGVVLALLASACAAIAFRTDETRPLYLTALALLAFHWLFHTVFGEELLLYSKHWNIATAIMLTALVPRRPTSLTTAAMSFTLLALAINSALVLAGVAKSLR